MLLLTSCSHTVLIPDIRVCGDQGLQGATCVHTENNIIEVLTLPEWNNQRLGMLCMSADDYAKVKAVQEKLCTIVNCKDQKLMLRLFGKINKGITK